jgi:small-conductance mechanosensitive channel
MTKWIIDILKANIGEDKVGIDYTKLQAAINAEYPKQAVPKEQYNAQAEKLKTLTASLEKLQGETKTTEQLQEEIKNYKEQVAEVQKALVAEKNAQALKTALTDAGATDIEYMIFKLGELETDKDGAYKNLDNKVKALKESDPNWFKTEATDEQDKGEKASGYNPLDTKLTDGKKQDQAKALEAEVDKALGLI